MRVLILGQTHPSSLIPAQRVSTLSTQTPPWRDKNHLVTQTILDGSMITRQHTVYSHSTSPLHPISLGRSCLTAALQMVPLTIYSSRRITMVLLQTITFIPSRGTTQTFGCRSSLRCSTSTRAVTTLYKQALITRACKDGSLVLLNASSKLSTLSVLNWGFGVLGF